MLGVQERDFWRLTPRQFLDQLEVYTDREKRLKDAADWRAGEIAAALFNAAPFRAEDAPWVEPADFFPGLPRKRAKHEEQTPEAQLAMWVALMGHRVTRES